MQAPADTAPNDPAVANLDLSVFTDDDLLNLILQRSEVMFDVPKSGGVIRAWNAGDMGPIKAQVDRLGAEIARRAAAVVHAEYLSLLPTLQKLKPGRIADIGCGYAFFDLFAARGLGSDLLLIDLESNERRHFGFEEEGAAYSSLSVARKLLEANGVKPASIQTLNPDEADVQSAGLCDLAVSFLSCGFHYPVDSYLDFFDTSVAPGGAIILDLRGNSAAAQREKLKGFGETSELPAPPKAVRLLIRKQ